MVQGPVTRSRNSESDLRQAYPIGDVERGQYVQANVALPVKAQDIDWMVNEALTVSTTVVQLTNRLVGYDYVKLVAEAAAVRFTLDDSAPSATVGWPLEVTDTLTLTGIEEVRDIKFIRRDSVDATLTVFYGWRII